MRAWIELGALHVTLSDYQIDINPTGSIRPDENGRPFSQSLICTFLVVMSEVHPFDPRLWCAELVCQVFRARLQRQRRL